MGTLRALSGSGPPDPGPASVVVRAMAHSSRKGTPPPRTCVVCGRTMEYRRKWAKNWDQVKYCSDACRGARRSGAEEGLEQEISRLLGERARDATICPSEVARALRPDDWRPLMEPVRDAARRLAARDIVEFRQGGRRVDPSTARGAIRLGRGAGWSRGAAGPGQGGADRERTAPAGERPGQRSGRKGGSR
jgi:hypothetical protein